MRSHMLFPLVLFALTCSAQVKCSDYDYAVGPLPYSNAGTVGHKTLSHSWKAIFLGTAFYSGTTPGKPCTIHASMTVQAAASDSGSLTPWYILDHDIRTSIKGGDVYSNGLGITADGEAAVSVEPCTFLGCGIAPSISGSGSGVGFSVSFPAGNIFPDSHYAKIAALGPVYPDPSTCSLTKAGVPPPRNPCGPSPIVVSTKHGMDATKAFSDPAKACVRFDLKNDGKPDCYSWPKKNSGVGFLVYDRDHDGGLVDSGAELFGDHTPHSDCGAKSHPSPNGYCALAFYDDPAQGGNQDMEITAGDKIWSQLRIWIPEHCWDNPNEACQSLPSELHKLEEFDVRSIGLLYQASMIKDKFGNAFRFYGQLNPQKHKLQEPEDATHERRSWDVFLAVHK